MTSRKSFLHSFGKHRFRRFGNRDEYTHLGFVAFHHMRQIADHYHIDVLAPHEALRATVETARRRAASEGPSQGAKPDPLDLPCGSRAFLDTYKHLCFATVASALGEIGWSTIYPTPSRRSKQPMHASNLSTASSAALILSLLTLSGVFE